MENINVKNNTKLYYKDYYLKHKNEILVATT